VFTIPWNAVHVAVESVFTIPWKPCSRSRGIRTNFTAVFMPQYAVLDVAIIGIILIERDSQRR
jgi:hypothetical protein